MAESDSAPALGSARGHEMNNYCRYLRKRRGSTIAETGPALTILFLFLFFPMLDLISMPIFYASCATLNDVQLREAVNIAKSEAESAGGPVKKHIPEQWASLGMGQFVGLTKPVETQVSYTPGVGDDIYVIVTTTINCRPFLTMPFFFPIPGMTTPLDYTISTKRLLENPHNFKA